MPEFMMLIADVEKTRAGLPPAEIAASYAKVGQWWEAQEKAGRIKAGFGRRLQPSATAKTVRVEAASASVTDGPFIESKEVVGGFAIIDAPTIDDAVAMVKTWPGLFVAIELRPVLVM